MASTYANSTDSSAEGANTHRTRWQLRGATLLAAALLTGCTSSNYARAPESTLPATPIGLMATREPVELTLATLIVYRAAGSWKDDALWDEYVVSLHNAGDHAVVLSTPTLLDPTGQSQSPGSDPASVEQASLAAEQRYRSQKTPFLRTVAPGANIPGTAGGAGVASTVVAGAATSAVFATSIVMLPLYIVGGVGIHLSQKADIEKEFARRRLVCPCTLAPGETRTGSLFFPMTPSPRSLSFDLSDATNVAALDLPLDALEGLHLNQVHVNRSQVPPPGQ